jgi:glycosyltransferase involved in cell wall biosynthesis
MPVVRPSNTSDPSFLQQLLIMNGLRARGHETTFVALADLDNVVCTTDVDEPKLVKRTWSASGWFNFAGKLSWRIQQWMGIPYLNFFSNLRWFDACLRCLPGHDIVQERNGLYKMGVAMACRQLKMPYIFFFDADDVLEHDLFGKPLPGVLRWRAKQVVRYNLKTADRVICVSESAKKHLTQTWNVPQEKIEVFPNGVDVIRFRPYPETRDEVRNKLGVCDNPLLIFVGSFFPYQDIPVLLKAFSQILIEFPKARLLLVGEGEQYSKMMQFAADLGITQSAQFMGFQPHSEVPQLLGAADIAVATYYQIDHDLFLGSPMKLFEYMASGIAIVASNLGQIKEIIQDGVNGLLVPPGDTQALKINLKRLLDDPRLRLQLGKQAREDVMNRYSWDQYISHLERVYEAVLMGSYLKHASFKKKVAINRI